MVASLRIRRRIARAAPGWVFTPSDFRREGSPQLVGMTLLALLRDGAIRRLGRGIYDVPRKHPILGDLLPKADDIAMAIARKHGLTIQPSEAQAANLLNLTTQVPAHVEYETDGPTRTVRVGNLTIRFRNRTPSKIRGSAKMSRLVFAALRNLGKEHVTPEHLKHLKKLLTPDDRRQLLADIHAAPAWMRPHVRAITGEAVTRPAVKTQRPLASGKGR